MTNLDIVRVKSISDGALSSGLIGTQRTAMELQVWCAKAHEDRGIMHNEAGSTPRVFVHPDGHRERVVATRIWALEHLLSGAVLGNTCALCLGLHVESGAVIDDRVTVKNHVPIFDKVAIADDVFIGPRVVFTNDLRPAGRGVFNGCPTISAARSAAGCLRIDVNTASPEGLTGVGRANEGLPTKGRARHRVHDPRHRTVAKIGGRGSSSQTLGLPKTTRTKSPTFR